MISLSRRVEHNSSTDRQQSDGHHAGRESPISSKLQCGSRRSCVNWMELHLPPSHPTSSTVTFTERWRNSALAPAVRGGKSMSKTPNLDPVLRDLLSGQYAYPVRIVVFNAIEGWSRDVTSEGAEELVRRAAEQRLELSPALDAFVAMNARRLVIGDAAAVAARGRRPKLTSARFSNRRPPDDRQTSAHPE